MDTLIKEIRKFRDDRDWMQFHDPKNMAISISIEAAELLEHFQWKDSETVKKHVASNKDDIADEIADIGIYLLELADNLGIDFKKAALNKLAKNAAKYPVDKAKGVATKYTDL
ncbi:nucleotide pyrophosphohydrolase [Elusimicrobiota bacterium]